MDLRKYLTCLLASTLSFGAVAQEPNDIASEYRWIEVEIILFTNTKVSKDIDEAFSETVKPIQHNRVRDFLSTYHFPNIALIKQGLNTCEAEREIQTKLNQTKLDKSFLTNDSDFEELFVDEELLNQFTLVTNNTIEYVAANTLDNNLIQSQFDQNQLSENQISDNDASQDQSLTDNEGAANDRKNENGTNENSANEQSTVLTGEVTDSDLAIVALKTPPISQQELDEAFNNTESILTLFGNAEEYSLEIPKTNCLFPEEFILVRNPFSEYYDEIDYNHFEKTILPRTLVVGEKEDDQNIHFLAKDSLYLNDLYKTLRKQPDIKPILHLGWRQPALPQRLMKHTRLFAGVDYSDEFDYFGEPVPQVEEDIFNLETVMSANTDNVELNKVSDLDNEEAAIENDKENSVADNVAALLSRIQAGEKVDFVNHKLVEKIQDVPVDTLPKQIWEIDGYFSVYHNKYLYTDAEFYVRKIESVEQQLGSSLEQSQAEEGNKSLSISNTPLKQMKTYHFKQNRRVITKEIHYLDHPHMGMILTTRRYKW